MKFRKSHVPHRIAKELEAAKEKALARMGQIEKRLAEREMLRTGYRHERERLEEIVVALGSAFAALEIDGRLEELLQGRPELLNGQGRERLGQIIEEKNAAIRKLDTLAKKVSGHSAQALAQAQETHSQMLEAEHLIAGILKKDAVDRLAQAHILGSLEERLHGHRAWEAHRDAAIRVADELVIDVPKRHSSQRHEPLRPESRSRFAKR